MNGNVRYMDNRFLDTISILPSNHETVHFPTFVHPKGNQSVVTIAKHSSGPSLRLQYTNRQAKGNHFLDTTLIHANDFPSLLQYRYPYSTDKHFREPIAKFPSDQISRRRCR